RTLDEDEVLFGDDLHDAEILDGALLLAHVTGHRLVFPDTTGCLTHTDRTNSAMEHGAVRSRTAGDAETFHHALEAFALGDADDVNELAFGERSHVQDISHFQGGGVGEADFAENAWSVIEAGLLR